MDAINITDRSVIDNFLLKHPESNFLQSWEWGQFMQERARHVERRLVVIGEDQALYTAVVEKARRGTYMTITGGPLLDWGNGGLVAAVFADIRSRAIANKCDFVRIRGQIELSDSSQQLFKDLGYRESPMPMSVDHAGILDISQTEEQVTAGMSQSLRRKIRKSQKLDLELTSSSDAAELDTFYAIHKDHSVRMGYVPFTKEFLVKQFKAFADNGKALVYTARKDGVVLAQNIIIFYGQEASYHYGVSTAEGVKLSTAPLLHLMAMEDARLRGCSRYNFWGIVEETDVKHRYYGVSQFKRSFGVVDLKHLPAHDLPLNKPRYLANWLLETVRRKRRKL